MRPEEQTPIYLKAKEIQSIVFSLVVLIEESELPNAREIELELLEDDLFNMKSLSSEILAHILNGSNHSFPYDLRMESAVMIRKAMRELQSYAYTIEDMGLKDIDYLDLIFEEIDEFRDLFIGWLQTFELWKYDDDDWGLFNPDGIQLIKTEFSEDEAFEDDDFEDDDDDDDDDDEF